MHAPGIGRTPLLYRRLAETSGVAVVASTGLYKEPLIPAIAYDWPPARLVDWMVSEIEEGMLEERLSGQLGAERSGVRAGLIKLASSDQGLQEVEAKTLRAAIEAARLTGAPIASHSTRAVSALAQLDILEASGFDPGRFVVVHSSASRTSPITASTPGAAPGSSTTPSAPLLTTSWSAWYSACSTGLAGQLLLSQDVCGWLVGRPNGGNDRRFAYLVTDFAPKLRAAGVSEADLQRILVENPRQILSFAR